MHHPSFYLTPSPERSLKIAEKIKCNTPMATPATAMHSVYVATNIQKISSQRSLELGILGFGKFCRKIALMPGN